MRIDPSPFDLDVEGAVPSDPRFRPSEPEHPMMLDGCMAPGDVAFMVRCMVEDLLMTGLPAEELRAMTRTTEYQALFAARSALGDETIDRILDETAARIGRRTFRTFESHANTQPATLTISARVPHAC